VPAVVVEEQKLFGENVLGRVPLMLGLSAATHVQPCPTASASGLELLQILAWAEATEAGSMRSTSGCGAMGGGRLARSLWHKLRRGVGRISQESRSDVEAAMMPTRRARHRGPGGVLETWMLWEMNEQEMM
jgi:hypothetical protein